MNKPEPMSEADIRRCYDAAHGGIRIVSSLSDFSQRVARAIEAERDAQWAARLEALQDENKRLRAAGRKLEAALSRIDYFCGEPNEMGVSGYDVHGDEDVVVQNVDALKARLVGAERDAGRLDWMSEHEVCLRWNHEGDLCRVWVRTDDEDDNEFEPVCGWGRAFNTAREAIDAARACLAKKNARAAITKEQP